MSPSFHKRSMRFLMAVMFIVVSSLIVSVSAAPRVPADVAGSNISGSYNIDYLTMNDGLPHNFVDDIYRDSNGFMWFAMAGGGLSRYDGCKFLDFGPGLPLYNIKGSFVIKMSEDPFKRLWVASDGGLDIIDINTLTPAEVPDPTGKLHGIMDLPGWHVATDAKGRIWLHSGRNIYCVAFDDSGEVEMVSEFTNPEKVKGVTIVKDVMGDGKPWAAIDSHVCRLQTNDDGLIIAYKVADCLDVVEEPHISDFHFRGGEVWIATDAGLVRYNPSENIAKVYEYDAAVAGSISQNYVTALAELGDGRLVAATLRGLNIYNSMRDDFETIRDFGPFSKRRGLNNDFINSLLVDGERLWIGTEGGGVNRFVPKRLWLTTIRNNCQPSGKAVDRHVNAIYTDENGATWVGAVEGGLHRTTDDFATFTHYNVETGSLVHNSVSAIVSDGQGRLWAGTWGGGISVLDIKTPGKMLRSFVTTSDGACKVGYVGALVCDRKKGKIWVGTSDGLFIYDLATDILKEAYPGSGVNFGGALGAVIDNDRILWMGTSTGLVSVDLDSFYGGKGETAVRHMRHRFNDPSSASSEKVTSLCVDSRGDLWIGTNANGLYKRTLTENGEETFSNYTTIDGLPNNVVVGIVEDREGNLWISTYRGMACMLPDGRIMDYDCCDGLDSDQFYWNAAALAKSGKVLFGSILGLVVIDAETLLPEPLERLAVKFTRFFIDNEYLSFSDGKLEMDGSNIRGLKFHESHKSFAVEFSALDYDRRGGTYFYRMVGFDDNWFPLPDDRNYVRFTSLPAGKYTLEVYYQDAGGGERLISALPVTVEPYFYKRWWFIMLMVAAACATVCIVHLSRLRSLKLQRETLRRAVAERTVEIEEKNRQLQQLTFDRISFFTNITHEFRTPITLILGPVERALKLSYNPQVVEQLKLVQRNSRYLLSLVNQLMDFRKVESGKMEIVRSRGNFLNFLRDVVGLFSPMAQERGISLRFVAHMPQPHMSYDEEALRKVMINLIGNAIKFTPDGGRVTVYAAVITGHGPCVSRGEASDGGGDLKVVDAAKEAASTDESMLYISVADTGSGIPEADIPYVFERFYQGSSQLKYPVVGSSGSGIGLYLCKGIVEIYGGSISVKNNHGGEGCTFRVVLPVTPSEIPVSERNDSGIGGINEEVSQLSGSSGETRTEEGRPRVLVVEDNPDMRSFIRSILRDDYTVGEAANGEEALEKLRNEDFDLIISDLMMPVMDGLELSRKVKENFSISHIPFLMLTAKTARESRLEGYRIGVDEYILKPFDEELLLARLKNILENKKRYQRSFSTDMEVDKLNIEEDSRDKKFMDQVMQVVKENYRNSYFEVGDFAEALGISRSLLNKKLQSLAGQSAGQLLRNYRMNLARELLERNRKTRAMNISEIAYEVGFNDAKYFTRCFSKHFGVTPSSVLNGE